MQSTITAAEAAVQAMLEDVPLWHRGRSKATGEAFYLAPSRTKAGVAHLCNAAGCTCAGYRHRGSCAHSGAVRAYEQRQASQFAETRMRLSYSELFPRCWTPGCQDDPEPGEGGEHRGCWKHANVSAF